MVEASRQDASPGKRAAVALVVTAALGVAAAVIAGPAAYLWLKAVHVIAIISWMAGMLYLPRLSSTTAMRSPARRCRRRSR